MLVYLVEKVVETEYGGVEVQAVFDSEEKAQDYIAQEIAIEQKYDPRYDGRFHPWYYDSEDGLPIFSIVSWPVE